MASDVEGVAAETAGAILGSVIGLAVGGAPGAIAGAALAPAASAGTRVAVANMHRYWAGQLSLLAKALSCYRQVGERETVESLTETPHGAALTHAAISAALSTPMQAKVQVLALVLADGVGAEPEVADELLEIVRVLDAVEAPHIAVLREFRTATPTRDQLAIAVPAYDRIVDSVHATLVGTGLIRERPVDGLGFGEPTVYELSSIGRRVLDYLDEIPSPATPSRFPSGDSGARPSP